MAIEFSKVTSITGPGGKDVTKITRTSDNVVLWEKIKWVIKDGKLVSSWQDPTGYGIGYFLKITTLRWDPNSPTKDDYTTQTLATVTQKSGYVEIKYTNVGVNTVYSGSQIALIGNGSDEGSNSWKYRTTFRAYIGQVLTDLKQYFSNMTISILSSSTVKGQISLCPTDGYSFFFAGVQKDVGNIKNTTVNSFTLGQDVTLSSARPQISYAYPWWHKNCTTQLKNMNISVGYGYVTSDLYYTWPEIILNVKDLYYNG